MFLIGITSTCVENTFRTIGVAKNIRDHLHMCGEYCSDRTNESNALGSPPHVWRIQLGFHRDFAATGITSTCVENTQVRAFCNG